MEYLIHVRPKDVFIFSLSQGIIKIRSLEEGRLGLYTPSFFLNQAFCPLPVYHVGLPFKLSSEGRSLLLQKVWKLLI